MLGTESLWQKVQALVGGKEGREESRWVQGESNSQREEETQLGPPAAIM